MAQSALRNISPTWWKDIKPQAPQKPVGQAISDVLGGVSIPLSAVPVVGDVVGLGADAAMYAAYPEERTMLNAGMSLAGLLPFVPGAGGVRAAEKAAEGVSDAGFRLYHGTPHNIGPSQRVIDLLSGKEYVSDPQMVQTIMAQNPGRYEVLGENPLGMFDINRVGTGEGAQAYGHGIYATEQPDIGRGYRDALAKRHGIDDTATVGKRPITEVYSEIENKAARLSPNAAQSEYEKLALLEQAMIDNDVLGVMERRADYSPEAFEWFEKTIAPNFSRPGALYELQVNAPQSRFLDWDKRIADQSPEVKKALGSAGMYDPAMTGREAYYMAAPNATNQAEASRALNQLGIPGIKYLDALSRTADGAGTRNYVLFDPKIADITAKYGVMGGAFGLSALRNIKQQEEK